LCALLRHARPLFATPPDAGPALRSGLVVSQVPPRPPSLNYRRARPRCLPCGSAPSCHTSVSSAHARAARVPWSASCLACTARVPRPPAPQPLPQLLPRARACALQSRTAAPLPRCYRTRGPSLAAPALVHVPVQLLHLLTPPAWRPFTPLGPRPAAPAPAPAPAPPCTPLVASRSRPASPALVPLLPCARASSSPPPVLCPWAHLRHIASSRDARLRQLARPPGAARAAGSHARPSPAPPAARTAPPAASCQACSCGRRPSAW
jgi:hypothetical protein